MIDTNFIDTYCKSLNVEESNKIKVLLAELGIYQRFSLLTEITKCPPLSYMQKRSRKAIIRLIKEQSINNIFGLNKLQPYSFDYKLTTLRYDFDLLPF